MFQNNSTLNNIDESKDQLLQSLMEAREQTDYLFSLVKTDAYYERPIPERNRIIFYLGHLEAFDWNQMTQHFCSLPSDQPDFDKLFAFGIDPGPNELPQDTKQDWPDILDVKNYHNKIRNTLDSILSDVPHFLLNTCLEHRLMHAETLVYMLHNLDLDKKNIEKIDPIISSDVVENHMIHIPEGHATLGANREISFGWDNEFNSHTQKIPAFNISKYKITNRNYLEFVKAGASKPHYWRQKGENWFYRTMYGEILLPMEWPVYVTHQQAMAYSRWQNKTLPNEAQFHRAAFGMSSECLYPWGDESPTSEHGNFNFSRWDPVPVSATPLGDSVFGVAQLVGNGWEWTSSVFAPFTGFTEFKNYPGYSRPFYDNAHYVLKGGSPQTALRLLRRSFRNWFRADYPYLYGTFRCVEAG